MQLPVTFRPLSGESDSTNLYYGKISEVSDGGMSIRTQTECRQTTGSKLALFVLPQSVESEPTAKFLVELKGEIVWKDSTMNSFGLKFL